jgi:hypothetical protein
MQDAQIVKKLFKIANRVSANAEVIREARRPWHLATARAQSLRHLKELNQIKDIWTDTYKPSRKRKFLPYPLPGGFSPWSWPYSLRRSRE